MMTKKIRSKADLIKEMQVKRTMDTMFTEIHYENGFGLSIFRGNTDNNCSIAVIHGSDWEVCTAYSEGLEEHLQPVADIETIKYVVSHWKSDDSCSHRLEEE